MTQNFPTNSKKKYSFSFKGNDSSHYPMNYLQRPTKISTNIRIKNAIVVLFSLLVLTFIAYIGSFFFHRCRDEGNITTLQIEITVYDH